MALSWRNLFQTFPKKRKAKQIAARPHSDTALGVYLLLLIPGILLVSLGVRIAQLQKVQITGTLNPANTLQTSVASTIELQQVTSRAPWSTVSALLTGLGMTFLTVTTFEGVKFLTKNFIYQRSSGKDFDEFFGYRASVAPHDGKVILQCDNVVELVNEVLEGKGSNQEVTSHMRSYKARNWLNRYDTDAARAIRDEFRLHGLEAPQIEIHDRNQKKPVKEILTDHQSNVPFLIATGLGFTDSTYSLINDLNWMKIEKDSICGDCLLLHTNFVPPKQEALWPSEKATHHSVDLNASESGPPTAGIELAATAEEKVAGTLPEETSECASVEEPKDKGKENIFKFAAPGDFIRLLPAGWKMDKWLDPSTTFLRSDYGLILRRTFIAGADESRKVAFVVAGFTERSTAIAGRYLAEHWHELWEKNVKGKFDDESFGYGDFLIVIAGPSDINNKDWKVALKLTPTDVGKDFEWPPL